MDYIDQQPETIRLYLLEDAIPLKQLNILASKRFSTNTALIEYGVLSESHFVTITNKNSVFSEILACADISGHNSVSFSTLLQKIHMYETDMYTYTIHTWVEKFIPEKYFRPESENATYHRVLFPIPNTNHDAHTEIEITNLSDNVIEINTTHTYPQCGKSVRSKSRLTPKY